MTSWSWASHYFVGLDKINAGLKEGVAALEDLVAKGVEESARRFNTEQKYKHIKVADDDDTRLRRLD